MVERAPVNKWTVTFLIDQNPPGKVILLQRSPEKSYAPNFYTGIGGKVGDLPGFENESALEGAYRELEEETQGARTRENTILTEFARCVYESGLRLYYFWGQYSQEALPSFSPSDGTLVWVSTGELLDKEIIPTTKAVCEEWANRGFRTDLPFTVYVREVGQDRTVRLIETLKVANGLQ